MLKLYNTATRRKQTLEPITPPNVLIYGCGPTVYGPAHIGNWRTFLLYDLLRRAVRAAGFTPRLVVNLTDVDDKTIKASQAAGQSLTDFTANQIGKFHTERAALNIAPPDTEPRATATIGAMTALVEKLLAAGIAYHTPDGIYFSLARYPRYGRLSRLATSTETARVTTDEYSKESSGDFALWKFWKESDGPVAWETPFGRGRPGWHLECSAMIEQELGQTIDIHIGGQDLIFPHHENEVAQSEAAHGAPLSNLWLHGAFVSVDGEKMSKSLGNVITLEDLLARGFDPLALRYLCLLTHYRHPLNFTWESLAAAQTALRKLRQTANNWHNTDPAAPELATLPAVWQETFFSSMADDLNFPQALADVWQMVKNKHLSPAVKLALLLEFDKTLGLEIAPTSEKNFVPEDILRLVRERETARKNGRFEEADRLRSAVAERGFQIEDTARGPRLRPN